MSTHKIIWYIAFTAAGIAVLVLWVRHAGETDTQATPNENGEAVALMLALLQQDHPMDRPQTRQAVRRVAELAAAGALSTAEAWYALGLWNAQSNSFDAAEKAFRRCLAIKPQWSWPHNALGIVLGNHTQNRLAEAEQEFRTAISLDPQWSRPHNDLAILLRLAGRIEEAEQEALTALRLEPENVATHNNYGNLLVAAQKLQQAEAEYLKAISIDPSHPKPYYNLACVYALQNKAGDAVSHLKKALQLDPGLLHDASTDHDFDPIRNNPQFLSLITPKI